MCVYIYVFIYIYIDRSLTKKSKRGRAPSRWPTPDSPIRAARMCVKIYT